MKGTWNVPISIAQQCGTNRLYAAALRVYQLYSAERRAKKPSRYSEAFVGESLSNYRPFG